MVGRFHVHDLARDVERAGVRDVERVAHDI
jgi:hypothetical protein